MPNNTGNVAWGNNAHLYRWLNSSADYGKWWTQQGDWDKPITAENVHPNYPYGFYHHRAGFLRWFTKPEQDVLLNMDLDGIQGKVLTQNYFETSKAGST